MFLYNQFSFNNHVQGTLVCLFTYKYMCAWSSQTNMNFRKLINKVRTEPESIQPHTSIVTRKVCGIFECIYLLKYCTNINKFGVKMWFFVTLLTRSGLNGLLTNTKHRSSGIFKISYLLTCFTYKQINLVLNNTHLLAVYYQMPHSFTLAEACYVCVCIKCVGACAHAYASMKQDRNVWYKQCVIKCALAFCYSAFKCNGYNTVIKKCFLFY